MGQHVELTVLIDSFVPGDERPATVPLDTPHPVNPMWDDLSDEERLAVLCIVRDGLLDLAGRPGEWVPSSFRAESDNRLDITITFDLDDIDAYVVGQQLEAAKEVEKMKERLLKMKASFDD